MQKPSVAVVTPVSASEREPERDACPPRFCGSADSEYCEGCCASTEKPARLIVPSITSSTWLRRVRTKANVGNQFKNKTVLIEAIHKSKAEKIKAEKLTAQQEARRQKNLDSRKRKAEKKLARTQA